MFTYRLGLNLQFFNDEFGGDGGAGESAAPIDSGSSVEGGEVAGSQPGTGEQLETGAQTGQENDIEQSKSFAKRLEERTQAKLAEARTQWEAENSEKYGNFDKYQRATDFFLQQAGYRDMDEMVAAIEQQELLTRAAEYGTTPEILQRMEQLEQKAKEADELRQKQEEQEVYQRFSQGLKEYATTNELDPQEFEDYMVQHQIPNFEVAHKAMKADKLEEQLKTAKEDAIREYLGSKKGPKVEGSGGIGIQSQEPTTNFNEARQRALARLRAANQQQ